MTTQDYINEELKLESLRQWRSLIISRRSGDALDLAGDGNEPDIHAANPSEVILLRAKVRELTDQLAAERARCVGIAKEYDGIGYLGIGGEIAAKIMEGGA